MARQTLQVQCSYRSLLTMWTSVTPPAPRSSARPGECLYPTSHGPSLMENPSELFPASDRSALEPYNENQEDYNNHLIIRSCYH